MISGSLIVSSCTEKKEETKPAEKQEFQWQIDQFDDIKVMRYQVPDWDSLTLQQKQFVYYLAEATYWGRDILYDQFFKYNLMIRNTLEGIYTTYEGDKECEDWKNFEIYLKKVWFANGIHHHYSNDKFTPKFSEEYFRMLLEQSKDGYIAMNATEGMDKNEFTNLLCDIIFNPDKYQSKNNTAEGVDIIAQSCNNFYENLTAKEVEDYYNKMQVPDTARPISKGLNSKLLKTADGGNIVERTYKIGGMYSETIEKIVENLEKAIEFAESDVQKAELRKLIEYYKTGDLTTWDEYNVMWAENTDPRVDYVNGFIENYGDPLGLKATWEAIVDFKDIEATKMTKLISENAQWFEDNSPVDKRFKKEKVKGVSAKAINVVALGGRGGSLEEFAASEEEIARVKKYSSITDNLHTDLHECLGHGSGQLLPDTDPNALKEHSSTLEEARADLFGLYYLADDKMVELGLLPDKEAYKAEYDGYIRNGLITQLTRILEGKNIEEAHMRNRALISRWCYENGKADNVIEMFKKDGNQRIKSEGDYAAGAAMVEKYAVKVDPELHKEVLERYRALNLAPYGGFVNPKLTQVFDEKGNLKDIEISYPDNFAEQMLWLSKNYSIKPKF